MLYLDHAATTPIRPEAREAMLPYLGESFGNPSGVHEVARRAKDGLEEARERAAALVGASRPLDIVFTGGGTESDNLGVVGAALGAGGGAVVSAVEHPAVLESVRFLERLGRRVGVVGVDSSGLVDPEEVASAAAGDGIGVVSVMAANNETGAVQPVARVAEEVRRSAPGVVVHTDAVQAFVSEVDDSYLDADLVTIASHKLGGPKGVGLLRVGEEIPLEPVLHGGGQEMGRRSGTHDVAGIVGMVAAMEAATADRDRFRKRVLEARTRFEEVLGARLGAEPTVTGPRLVQHSHLRIPGGDVEALLIRLDHAGVFAAAGSACHSGAIQASHVLEAMGMDGGAAAECVRFTFGWPTQPADGDEAAALVAEAVEAMR